MVMSISAGKKQARLLVKLMLVVCCGSMAAAGAKDHLGASSGPGDESIESASLPAVSVLPQPPNRSRPSRARVDQLIKRYAKRYGVENALIHSVVRAESGYNAHAVSTAGAIGLMQIMPATGADYGVGSADKLFDAQTNLRVGIRHLKRLVNRYGIGKAVMAYNAGEGTLQRHNGFVTYPETQRYTHRVLTSYLNKKGIGAYSSKARAVTGITLTPAMASAGPRAGGASGGKRRLLRSVDLSRLSLRVRPSLSDRALDPNAHAVGPESKPMFVLDPAVRKQ
jgi:hypothetical protein